MFTKIKELRKAFNIVFKSKKNVPDDKNDNIDSSSDSDYISCSCGNRDNLVSADSVSIKDAFLEYCNINLIDTTELMSVHTLTKNINFRVKYTGQEVDHEFEITIGRFKTIQIVACIECSTCMGAYLVHNSMYPEFLTKKNHIGSIEEYFDKIFRKKERIFIERNREEMIKKERVKRAREICGYK